MKKITLKDPIPYGDGTLDEITVRVPGAGEMRGISLRDLAYKMDTDALIKLLPRISTPVVTQAQAAHISLRDTSALFGIIADFFDDTTDSPTTLDEPLPS